MHAFDKVAGQYDAFFRTKKGRFIDTVESMTALSLIDHAPGMKVLDIGCGTGVFSFKLARRGCDVTGVDLSEKMLGEARRKVRETSLEVDFKTMDATRLAFGNDSFDLVVSMATLEFMNDPEAMMHEAFRVVKPGGQVLMGTINKDSDWGQHYASMTDDPVYSKAVFLGKGDLEVLSVKPPAKIRQCLFIPPDAEEAAFNLGNEEKLKHEREGGFLCAVWET